MGRSAQVERSVFVKVVFMITRFIVRHLVSRFVRDERGATMLEYGLLVGLVAVVAIAGLTLFGGSLNTMFGGLSDTVGDVETN